MRKPNKTLGSISAALSGPAVLPGGERGFISRTAASNRA